MNKGVKFITRLHNQFTYFLYKLRRRNIYKLRNWKNFTPENQIRYYHDANPYTDWMFFKEIETDFSLAHGNQPGIKSVFCGNAGTLGPFFAICVTIKRGSKRVSLPKEYLGFPVLRFYESQRKSRKL